MICAMSITPQNSESGSTIKLEESTSLTCGTQCYDDSIHTGFPGVYTVQWFATITSDTVGNCIIQVYNDDSPVIGSKATETVSPGTTRSISTAPVPVVLNNNGCVSLTLRNLGCQVTVSDVVLFLKKVY